MHSDLFRLSLGYQEEEVDLRLGARSENVEVLNVFFHENRPMSRVMGSLWLHRWLEMQDLSFMRRLKPTTKVKVQVLYLIFNFEISSPF